jgi:tetratricopeptide (TPR) repeat protein
LIHLLLAAAVASGAPGPKALITGQSQRPSCGDLITADALICRALDAEKRGDNAGAAQGFDEAAKTSSEKDPKTARMYAAAGNLWISANEPAKASADFDKALALPGLDSQQRGEALLDRARAAEAANDLVTARQKLTEAAQTISQDPFYWYFSASLALREHDAVAARSAIDHALKLSPSDPAILFEAGHVADYSGDDEQARSYWRRAAASDPNGPVGRAAGRAIEMLGVAPTVKGDTTQAIPGRQPRS